MSSQEPEKRPDREVDGLLDLLDSHPDRNSLDHSGPTYRPSAGALIAQGRDTDAFALEDDSMASSLMGEDLMMGSWQDGMDQLDLSFPATPNYTEVLGTGVLPAPSTARENDDAADDVRAHRPNDDLEEPIQQSGASLRQSSTMECGSNYLELKTPGSQVEQAASAQEEVSQTTSALASYTHPIDLEGRLQAATQVCQAVSAVRALNLHLQPGSVIRAKTFARLSSVWRFDEEWTKQLYSVLNDDCLWTAVKLARQARGSPVGQSGRDQESLRKAIHDISGFATRMLNSAVRLRDGQNVRARRVGPVWDGIRSRFSNGAEIALPLNDAVRCRDESTREAQCQGICVAPVTFRSDEDSAKMQACISCTVGRKYCSLSGVFPWKRFLDYSPSSNAGMSAVACDAASEGQPL